MHFQLTKECLGMIIDYSTWYQKRHSRSVPIPLLSRESEEVSVSFTDEKNYQEVTLF